MMYYILKGEDNDGFADMAVIDIINGTEEEAKFRLGQYEASIEKYPYYRERRWYKLMKEVEVRPVLGLGQPNNPDSGV